MTDLGGVLTANEFSHLHTHTHTHSLSLPLSLQVTAWFGWLTLMIIIACYGVWLFMVYMQHRRAKKNREILVKEQEQHGHGPEDDDKVV